MNHEQLQIIDYDYLREENRALHAPVGSPRLRFDDDQRRDPAERAKAMKQRVVREVATIVTPETLLRWHRKLTTEKHDGSAKHAPEGRGPSHRSRPDSAHGGGES